MVLQHINVVYQRVNFATHFDSSLLNCAQSSSPSDATLCVGMAGSWTMGSWNRTGKFSLG